MYAIWLRNTPNSFYRYNIANYYNVCCGGAKAIAAIFLQWSPKSSDIFVRSIHNIRPIVCSRVSGIVYALGHVCAQLIRIIDSRHKTLYRMYKVLYRDSIVRISWALYNISNTHLYVSSYPGYFLEPHWISVDMSEALQWRHMGVMVS